MKGFHWIFLWDGRGLGTKNLDVVGENWLDFSGNPDHIPDLFPNHNLDPGHDRSGNNKKAQLTQGLRIGCSRSSKVVDFGTNRKGICNFLLVINSNFGPILHCFWDMANYWLKIANFSYPTLVWRPRSGGTLSNFWRKLTEQELVGWGYCMVKTARS